MLTIYDAPKRYGRRDFLKVGSLALGGLTLPQLLSARADAATREYLHNKSVVFLHMLGGPTQTETFDPKMRAPSEYRSAVGACATRLPGVEFGSTMQNLAGLADKLTVVRSYRTNSGAHDIKPVYYREGFDAGLGAIYASLAGTNNPNTGMPTNTAIFPRAVNPEAQPMPGRFNPLKSAAAVGKPYAPFIPGSGGQLQSDMKLHLEQTRLDDRRSLLARIDRIKRDMDNSGQIGGADRFQQQAFQTIVGGVADAFDLSKEDAATIARYDTSGLMDVSRISKKWNNHKHYADHVRSLGKLMLLARRLCEAGCGFVTVSTNFVWDMHADSNNATLDEGMQYVGAPFDHAVSAFIQDCEQRGLSDDILLICTGEMGRTPKINSRGGRDHWGGISPLLIYGGGLNHGQVIGQSDRQGGTPATQPMEISNLVATIFHTLIDIGQLRIAQGVPANVLRYVTKSDPIPGLL